MTAQCLVCGLGLVKPSSEEESSDESSLDEASGAAVGASDAQAVLRKERADRERRLEGLPVAVLIALGERDGAVRDTERRARGGAADNDCRGGPVAAGGGRVMRQCCPYGAGGVSATPTRARPARRQRPMSA
jgi:hypothetical protein